MTTEDPVYVLGRHKCSRKNSVFSILGPRKYSNTRAQNTPLHAWGAGRASMCVCYIFKTIEFQRFCHSFVFLLVFAKPFSILAIFLNLVIKLCKFKWPCLHFIS